MLLMSDQFKHAVLAVMLLAIVFAWYKGRNVVSADGRSRAWTHVPLIALLTVSIGPSVIAMLLWLGYDSGLLQPGRSGYRFSSFVFQMPLEFAFMNWGFAVLYVVCRLSANSGAARLAMWLSAIAMLLFNVPLFFLAREMIADVVDAGQGIGIVQVMLGMPVWFGPYPAFLDPESIVGALVLAPLAPIPLAGLIGWIAGRFIGGAFGVAKGKTARS